MKDWNQRKNSTIISEANYTVAASMNNNAAIPREKTFTLAKNSAVLPQPMNSTFLVNSPGRRQSEVPTRNQKPRIVSHRIDSPDMAYGDPSPKLP